MKNNALLLYLVLIALTFLACGSTQNNADRTIIAQSPKAKQEKVLVVYFSHTGTTKVVATKIHAITGGDIFEIVTENTYPQDYNASIVVARKEKENNFRPKLTTRVADMKLYDTVFLGYPNWLNTMPMAVFTFLESYDFAGKTIIPFCTHGGGRFGNSVDDIKKLCPQSKILAGIAIKAGQENKADKEISAWLQKMGF